MTPGLVVDLFAGGGGASSGIEAALGRPVDVAINHDAIALAVHRANHPGTVHLESDVWDVSPEVATQGRPVDLLWASPDCTHFSVAKGGKPRRQRIRSLAWVVVRWAKAVRPRVIFMENVSEFRGWGPLDRNGYPLKQRMGETFRRWKGGLRRLGYEVDYRVLDASLYGAPTRRRRLFLVARCDGQPILWPEPTHGPGRLPLRMAAECIDWSLPCPSIFERKRPLAEKTMWRIAQGIRRFVLENPQPFIVRMAHGEVAPDGVTKRRGHGAHGTDGPLPTITGSGGGGGFAVAVPVVAGVGGRAGQSPATPGDAPLGTVTAKNDRVLVAPSLVKVNHGKREARGEAADSPLSTVTAERRGHALVAPTLVRTDMHQSNAGCTYPPEDPLRTITSSGGHAVVAPTLVQVGYGEREGQAARVPGLQKPLGTVVAGGMKHALVAAFLARHFGGMVGPDLPAPLHTVTSKDHHSLVTAELEALDEGDGRGAEADPDGRDRGAAGRHDLEAPQPQYDAFPGAAQGGDHGQERISARESLPGSPSVRRVGTPAVVDGSAGADPGRAGDQPQGRQHDAERSGKPGARDRQPEQSPRISHARPEVAAIDPPANPREGGTGGQGAAGPGPELLGDREPHGHQPDVGVPSNPPPVVTFHVGEVRAFLTAFYGSDGTAGKGQTLLEPMRTVTARHRLGLVTIEGSEYQIVDIGMRMLEPHELLAAQFGRFAAAYDLSAARTKGGKVRLIGNSVCPEVAEAVVLANLSGDAREAVA